MTDKCGVFEFVLSLGVSKDIPTANIKKSTWRILKVNYTIYKKKLIISLVSRKILMKFKLNSLFNRDIIFLWKFLNENLLKGVLQTQFCLKLVLELVPSLA